jgi:hypothetical protein
MAAFNPLRAVGTLHRGTEHESATFLGSCFALRSSTAVLTAAHCIGELAADEIAVRMPHLVVLGGPEQPRPSGITVAEIIRHPDADVALLKLRIGEWIIEPFWNSLPAHGLGEDLMAYGYPEDLRSDEREPTARLFKGYIQRVYQHTSFLGYRYVAYELDFACPAGLSGGPLFRPGAPQMVLGIATENFESTTYTDAFEEVTREGSIQRTQYQRVIAYGAAVSLEAIGDWLNEHLPMFDSSAWAARQQD